MGIMGSIFENNNMQEKRNNLSSPNQDPSTLRRLMLTHNYANWIVDYLKYDNCHNGSISPQKQSSDARRTNKTVHPIFYSLWDHNFPAWA